MTSYLHMRLNSPFVVTKVSSPLMCYLRQGMQLKHQELQFCDKASAISQWQTGRKKKSGDAKPWNSLKCSARGHQRSSKRPSKVSMQIMRQFLTEFAQHAIVAKGNARKAARRIVRLQARPSRRTAASCGTVRCRTRSET